MSRSQSELDILRHNKRFPFIQLTLGPTLPMGVQGRLTPEQKILCLILLAPTALLPTMFAFWNHQNQPLSTEREQGQAIGILDNFIGQPVYSAAQRAIAFYNQRFDHLPITGYSTPKVNRAIAESVGLTKKEIHQYVQGKGRSDWVDIYLMALERQGLKLNPVQKTAASLLFAFGISIDSVGRLYKNGINPKTKEVIITRITSGRQLTRSLCENISNLLNNNPWDSREKPTSPTEPAVKLEKATVSPSPSPETPPALKPSASPALIPTKVLVTEAAVTDIPPTQESPSTLVVDTAIPPSQIFSLDNWKLTLPTGPAKDATEVLQQKLAGFLEEPWFVVVRTADGQAGIRFRAPVTGSTTEGSEYPRSELREMNPDGTKAAWSSSEGRHTMTADLTITHLPKGKQHIVVAQIHGAEDDIVQIRLEGTKLKVDVAGEDGPVLDENYALGSRFTVKIEVSEGRTKVSYLIDDEMRAMYDITNIINEKTGSSSYSGAYFKVGAYTQSNCTKEGEKAGASADCSLQNFGEVIFWELHLKHD